MNYSLFIARRLSFSSGGKKTAPAVSVAMAAVALSIGVMIASVAIVLGFKQEIREKVIGFNSHISLFVSPTETDDDNLLTLSPELKSELDKIPFISDYCIQASIPTILKTQFDFKGVYLKGLSGKDSDVDFLKKNLEEGEVADYSDGNNKDKVVISRNAARQLGLKVGDKIDAYFISDDVRVRRLEITGIFNSHFDQYDEVLIFGALSLVQQLGSLNANQGTYLAIKTDNFNRIEDYSMRLRQSLIQALEENRLSNLYYIDNVLNQSIAYFSWLSLLDTNVAVVLILMIIVGCITLVSAMLIIIIEKKNFVGLIKAMGAPNDKVRRIFIYLALKIAVKGMLIGNIVILIFLWIQKSTHFLPLDAESYYIDYVPVDLSFVPILSLNVGVLLIIFLSLLLPSAFVSRISPAETIKFE